MPTTIAVDARQVYRHGRRGTGKNLIDLYGGLAAARPDWRFVMFHEPGDADDPFAHLPNVERRPVAMRGDRFHLWEQLRLPLEATRQGATVLHCPANTGPRFPLRPMLLTIHDLIPLESAPDTAATRAWLRRVTTAARKARHIVTPSQYSKRQIMQHLDVPASKVTVNPWAADRRCRRVSDPAELERVRRNYNLAADQPYVFGFGSADPRKNTRRIIEAWAKLPTRWHRDHRLLLVGIEDNARPTFTRLATERNVRDSVLLHGFADEDDVAALLSGAILLCYPSLNEGFGLPVLDGFACGTPVLTSNATSLPEVAGDAALLVDPTQTHALYEGLEHLLNDRYLRAELVERGQRRLEAFTWHDCIDRLARLFEEIALAS